MRVLELFANDWLLISSLRVYLNKAMADQLFQTNTFIRILNAHLIQRMHAHALTKQSEAPVDEQLRAATTSRVPFGAYDAFATFENALKVAASPKSQAHDISRKATSYRSPRDSDKYPSFRTMPRSDGGGGNTALKAEAARRNDAIRAPYRAPSDQRLRLDSPATSWLAEDTDFQAKFVLPSNQDLRRRTALDQVSHWWLTL